MCQMGVQWCWGMLPWQPILGLKLLLTGFVWTVATRQLVVEGGLSGRPTECRYCRCTAPKGRCRSNHFLAFYIWGAYCRHLANTTEPSMCGGDVALCQITLTICLVLAPESQHKGEQYPIPWDLVRKLLTGQVSFLGPRPYSWGNWHCCIYSSSVTPILYPYSLHCFAEYGALAPVFVPEWTQSEYFRQLCWFSQRLWSDQCRWLVQLELLRDRLREKDEALEKKSKQLAGLQMDRKRLETELSQVSDQTSSSDRQLGLLKRKVCDVSVCPSVSVA